MPRTFCLLSAIVFNVFAFNLSVEAQGKDTSGVRAANGVARTHAEFVGRYSDGEDFVVYFESTKYGMTVRPALWTSKQLLVRRDGDKFIVVDRPARTALFHRDAKGRVSGVTLSGFDAEDRNLSSAHAGLLPVELLVQGRGREAARAYLAKGEVDLDKLLRVGARVLDNFPSRPAAVVGFLSELAGRFPANAALYNLLSYAQVAALNRVAALKSFRRAYALQSSNKDAISGLARLNSLPPEAARGVEGWTIPFPLNSVFEKPTTAEIREVEADWKARDLRPAGVQEIAKGRIDLGQSNATVRIVSHLVQGSHHYGAIIIPDGARPGCCPVIIEAKGVSPTYFPLELEKLQAPRLLAEFQRRFIYVVPTFRGEVLNFAGATYQSEGDRRNALDGATDDAIALLNVALETTPEADAARICAFGHSRGGTVALLAGIRDSRIRCVAEWAGPVDWYELMGTGGWTEQELYAEGLRTRATPTETGGQNVERFLMKAIRGEETLQSVRHRMLASSPLYFARRLPRAQLHYGEEDSSVPVRNGRALWSELKRRAGKAAPYEAHFYRGAGHDTDRIIAPVLTREFLIKTLLSIAPRRQRE